ncbi:MAG: GNAT family N-acetyltransferase [Leeuwenhoekiella sp.]
MKRSPKSPNTQNDFNVNLLEQDDVTQFQKLAHKIWPITYKDVLSKDQISYMLEMMYSREALREQQEDGCDLYLLQAGEQSVGFLSLQHDKDNSGKTKVQKIYVLTEYQGTGAGRFLMNFAIDEAKKRDATAVFLNVNRYNKALGFYEHFGFRNMYSEDNDIGEGYLMEDFVMEMPIPSL